MGLLRGPQSVLVARALEMRERVVELEVGEERIARAEPHGMVDAGQRFGRAAAERMRDAEQAVRVHRVRVERDRAREAVMASALSRIAWPTMPCAR